MNLKYYQRDFQATAAAWWRTLSINEMKALEKKYKVIGDEAMASEIAEMFDKEIEQATEATR